MSRWIALASGAALSAALLISLLIMQLVQPASATGGTLSAGAGGGHTCAVTAPGGVLCWGANGSGQLGNGAAEDEALPVVVYTCEDLPDAIAGLPPECVPLEGVREIAAGYTHTCGLHATGIVLCWGRNTYGQLGDTTTDNRAVAVPVCSGMAAAGAAGAATSCCPIVPSPTPTVTSTQTATGTATPSSTPTRTATPASTPGVTPTPGPCAMLDNVTGISAGINHTCALTEDGTVWCWGENGFGQLGNGTTLASSLPVHVCAAAGLPLCAPLTGVTAIDAGGFHTCAVLQGGGAACWGNNSSGQLGDGSFEDSDRPVHVCAVDPSVAGAPCLPLSEAYMITGGGSHSCAVMEDSGLICWGENSLGQIGDGTSFDRAAPVAPCRDVPTPTATPTRTPTATPTAAPSAAGESACCSFVLGGSPAGALSCSLEGVAEASAGGEHTCAILEEHGEMLCWGSNISGQLGDGTTFHSPLPVPVCGEQAVAATTPAPCGQLLDAAAVTAGHLHTCAQVEDGGVLCWGDNLEGKVGDGTNVDRRRPVEVERFARKPTATPTRTTTATPATGTATATLPAGMTQTPTRTPTAPAGGTPTRTSTAAAAATTTSTRTPTNTPTRTPAATTALDGDVNCDGEVDAIDGALILQLVAALIATVPCPNNVDVDDDGSVNPIDAALVLQYAAGLILDL